MQKFKIDGSPSCVKHDSVSKLIQRGWAINENGAPSPKSGWWGFTYLQ